jgi:diacylglycerol kinase (ATP)
MVGTLVGGAGEVNFDKKVDVLTAVRREGIKRRLLRRRATVARLGGPSPRSLRDGPRIRTPAAVMPGIGIVVNPRSRQNRQNPGRMRHLGYIVGTQGEYIATKSLDDITRVAEMFKKAEIDILGINGGDGTNHCTLTSFIEVYGDAPLPRIAFLRGGTMNTIANSCGVMRASPGRILYNLIEKYHLGEPFSVTQRNVLKVGDHYGFIFGNGVIQNFLEIYYDGGDASPWKAAKVMTRSVCSAIVGGPLSKRLFEKFRARIISDGEEWALQEFVTVGAATIDQLGFGFRPFYRAEERPDRFHVLGIHCNAFGFARDMPRIHAGKPMRRDKVVDRLASEVVIKSEIPVKYTIDGDTHEFCGELKVSLGPRLQIIQE